MLCFIWLEFIILWQIQIGEPTLSSVIMTLVLLYEPLPDMGESFLTRLEVYKRYLIWLKYHVKEIVRSPVGYSHCNCINSYAPPSSINRRMIWSFCVQQLNYSKELLLCQNHLSTKTLKIQLELIWKFKTFVSASDYLCKTQDFTVQLF